MTGTSRPFAVSMAIPKFGRFVKGKERKENEDTVINMSDGMWKYASIILCTVQTVR